MWERREKLLPWMLMNFQVEDDEAVVGPDRDVISMMQNDALFAVELPNKGNKWLMKGDNLIQWNSQSIGKIKKGFFVLAPANIQVQRIMM